MYQEEDELRWAVQAEQAFWHARRAYRLLSIYSISRTRKHNLR
jgi:hypothetical protein